MEITMDQLSTTPSTQSQDLNPTQSGKSNVTSGKSKSAKGKKFTRCAAEKTIAGTQVTDENARNVRHITVGSFRLYGSSSTRLEPTSMVGYGCTHSETLPSDGSQGTVIKRTEKSGKILSCMEGLPGASTYSMPGERQMIVFFERHTDMLFALRTSFDIAEITYNWSRGEPFRQKQTRSGGKRTEGASNKTSPSKRSYGQNPARSNHKNRTPKGFPLLMLFSFALLLLLLLCLVLIDRFILEFVRFASRYIVMIDIFFTAGWGSVVSMVNCLVIMGNFGREYTNSLDHLLLDHLLLDVYTSLDSVPIFLE
ncbi:hypothetical protein RCL_jg9672.t1 [Rhizophagus clarus]|uniref:Uncharacterized protein n=1 Tax=Rhizophagus clarus TaxID=94130 RepID=A0A8H3M0G6_9GLOM|nr:hypothetical protein RCL_jg9672.t1 [Rhizophagus clarus]